jgi:hypothetical protein
VDDTAVLDGVACEIGAEGRAEDMMTGIRISDACGMF